MSSKTIHRISRAAKRVLLNTLSKLKGEIIKRTVSNRRLKRQPKKANKEAGFNA